MIENVNVSFKQLVRENKGNSVIILLRENHYVPLGLDNKKETYRWSSDSYEFCGEKDKNEGKGSMRDKIENAEKKSIATKIKFTGQTSIDRKPKQNEIQK